MLEQAVTAGAITSTQAIPASASVSATGNSNINGGITNIAQDQAQGRHLQTMAV
jgi:hypothetical protein